MPCPYHLAREISSTRENFTDIIRQFKYQMYCVYNKFYNISGRTYNRSGYGWPHGENRTCTRERQMDQI